MRNDTTTYGDNPVSLSQALGFEEGDHVSVATNGARSARTVSTADLDADYALGMLDQIDTWIGAQPVKATTGNKRAKASDVAQVRVLYVDFDRKDGVTDEQIRGAIDELSEVLEAQPISVVDSGGGLHPRWKLDSPLTPEDAKGALNRWKMTVQRVAEAHGMKVDSVFDLPRLLRLPGTVNTKYGDPVPTRIAVNPEPAAVAPAAVWSRLDHTTKAKAPQAQDTSVPVEESKPIERPATVSTLSERAVNSEVQRDLDRLARLQVEGWKGDPWHNTTRDIAYRLAKIAASPNTHWTVEEMAQQFFQHAPRDDEFGFDQHAVIWEGGLERVAETDAEYELVGSGDELFGDDLDEMIAASRASQPRPDIDPALSLDDLGDSPAPKVIAGAQERFEALPMPLIPGFRGVAALRTLEVPAGARADLLDRLRIIGEDVSDFHMTEHQEYMHPHCPACFPDTWREQLYRWTVANPRINSLELRPPIGRQAPGEGYVSGLELLDVEDGEMLVEGFVPADAVGLVIGRGGGGKTFSALDIAMSVLDPSVEHWRLAESYADEEIGRVSTSGKVFFLAGEGFRGLKWRVKSWLSYNGYTTPPDWLENLTVRSTVPDMFMGDLDFQLLLEEVARDKPRLIVVDTLQKAAGSAEQNSSSEMGVVHMRLSQLRAASDGGTVLLIAHTDKNDISTRGSSSIEDDSDFVLHVRDGSNGGKEIEVTKMRDGEAPGPLPFHLAAVGRSAVVSATAEVEALKTPRMEQNRIEVLTAIHEIHSGIGDFTADVSLTDINTQVAGVEKPDVMRTLALLIADGHVMTSAMKKYQLTPRGRAWIESKSAHLTALSRGFSS